jgi:hypothetical protein
MSRFIRLARVKKGGIEDGLGYANLIMLVI